MQLQKVRLLRLMSKIALGFLAMVALFWIVGVTWAPSWIKESVEQYSQRVGYHLELKGIVVKPFALKVELRGLKLKKIQGKELFSLDRGMLSVQWSKLIVGEISIDAIELDGPSHRHNLSKKHFCELRDDNLRRDHGIRIERVELSSKSAASDIYKIINIIYFGE
jgi:uncharacterized protein involved in outer membrane biogenesis